MKKNYLTFILIISALALFSSGCANKNSINQNQLKSSINTSIQGSENQGKINKPPAEFLGEKGETIFLIDRQIVLESKIFTDNLTRYYNTKLPNGKIIYFFIIKDESSIYRAAANACRVCFDDRMGFRQEGDFMVCNTCGNKYPLEKIATEKGGCNPGPINPNLKVENGKIIIKQLELEQVADLF